MFLVNRLTIPAVMALAVTACQKTQALEDIRPGTDVVVETEDGRHVTGQLVSVDADSVAVETERARRRVQITRTAISDVNAGQSAQEMAMREVVAPSGTSLDARLETAVASATSAVEDPVRATLESPVVVDGVTLAPRGSTLLGEVTSVQKSGRVKGRAELGVRFSRLQVDSVTYDIDTTPLRWVAGATKSDDATKVGIGAVAGAIVGGITGGGKGAAVGSAVGAGGGTAVVLSTKGKEIELHSGSSLHVRLAQPFAVKLPAAGDS
jgi:hypothetical protein